MEVVKSGKTIIGGRFTVAERKALEIEVRKESWKIIDDAILEINAAILWRLHNSFGWGPERLKRFYKDFRKDTEAICKMYELPSEDAGWANVEALKAYGIDIREWAKEFGDGGIE